MVCFEVSSNDHLKEQLHEQQARLEEKVGCECRDLALTCNKVTWGPAISSDIAGKEKEHVENSSAVNNQHFT